MKAFKVIFGTLFALALAAGCGYLMYMFYFITYLPHTLSILLMVLCGIGVLATIHIWVIFIRSLKSKKQDKNQDDDDEKAPRNDEDF